MASFAPNKIDTTAINGGQRYQNGDVVDANAINAPIEASAWAQQAAEEAQVKADYALQKVNESEIGEITLSAYPIGSIYLSVVDTSPASLFGGTWEKIKDAFLWASGDVKSITYTNNGQDVTRSLAAGSNGGEFTHTLTMGEMPAHKHYMVNSTEEGTSTIGPSTMAQWSLASDEPYSLRGNSGTADMFLTGTVGSSSKHNNMPPYLAVNAWKRIS